MPRLSSANPKYCYHKASGQAVVHLEGRCVYRGRYNTPESRANFDRVVGTYLLNHRRLLDDPMSAGSLAARPSFT